MPSLAENESMTRTQPHQLCIITAKLPCFSFVFTHSPCCILFPPAGGAEMPENINRKIPPAVSFLEQGRASRLPTPKKIQLPTCETHNFFNYCTTGRVFSRTFPAPDRRQSQKEKRSPPRKAHRKLQKVTKALEMGHALHHTLPLCSTPHHCLRT